MAENRNDFFILHGITCSWALSKILHLIPSTELKLEILQNFICILLAVYIAKDRPKLNPEYLVTPDVSNVTWDDIIARTIKMPLGTDEHEFKVVQVYSLQTCSKGGFKLQPTFLKFSLDQGFLIFCDPVDL
jgi:hypothetical protein